MNPIDFHVHPLSMISEEQLLKEVREAGLSRAVLLAIDVDRGALDSPERTSIIAQEMFEAGIWDVGALDTMKTILELAYTPNLRVAELVSRHPSTFLGVGSVNPSMGVEYVRETLERIDSYGFIGVKILATLQMFRPESRRRELTEIFSHYSGGRGVVVIHTGCDPGPWENPVFSSGARPSRYVWLFDTFPDVEVVLAHSGSYSRAMPGIWLREAVEIAARHDNVWMDTAAVTYLATEEKYASLIREDLGWSRVLFGSDYPVTGRSIKEVLRAIMASSALSQREKEALLIDNPRELLKGLSVEV